MRVSQIIEKNVVNISDASCIGIVVDVGFNKVNGQIESLIIEQISNKKILKKLKNSHELVLPFKSIVTMGEEVILVNYGNNNGVMV